MLLAIPRALSSVVVYWVSKRQGGSEHYLSICSPRPHALRFVKKEVRSHVGISVLCGNVKGDAVLSGEVVLVTLEGALALSISFSLDEQLNRSITRQSLLLWIVSFRTVMKT